MKSLDFITAYLRNKNIEHKVLTPTDDKHRWKWAIKTDSVDVYMIHNSRFLIMQNDNSGVLMRIEAYVKSKYEVAQKLEDWL